MVVGSLLILGAAVLVEARVEEPVVPLHVVRRRDPALAIVASLSVGMAMFGGAVFLGQYFQIGRGYSPIESGLLTIPLMFGVLLSSTLSGRLVSRTGKVKPFILAGVVLLTLGFLALSTIDHTTDLVIVGAGMFAVGAGVGMSMQNLVLVLQNTVPLRELGAASGAITFFRSLGGTMGVSVLGAVLAARVATEITAGLKRLGVDPAASSGGSTLNLKAMPPEIQEVVRAAYGDATGHIFLIAACIALVGVVARRSSHRRSSATAWTSDGPCPGAARARTAPRCGHGRTRSRRAWGSVTDRPRTTGTVPTAGTRTEEVSPITAASGRVLPLYGRDVHRT